MRTHAHLHTLTYKHTHTPTHTQECIYVYEYTWTRRCNCTQVYTQTSSYDTHTLHTLTGFHTAIQKIQPATHTVRYCNMLQHSTLKVVNTFKDMSRLLPQLTPLATSYSCIAPQTALQVTIHVTIATIPLTLENLYAVCGSVLQCVAVCCSVLQCVAVCYSVWQCLAVCCIAPTHTHVLCMYVSSCVCVCVRVHACVCVCLRVCVHIFSLVHTTYVAVIHFHI